MKATRLSSSIVVGIFLTFVTTLLLILINYAEITSDVTPIMIVVSGMTAMGAMIALQRFIEEDRESSLAHITFDEAFLSTSISEGLSKFEASQLPTEQEQVINVLPWDLTAGQLVGIDNKLALARLRMDIERELRRIAHEAKIDISIRPVGATGLARELVSREVFPVIFLEALHEIVTVCNKGIHGEEVSDDLAASVVRVGSQLLEQLRLLPKHFDQS